MRKTDYNHRMIASQLIRTKLAPPLHLARLRTRNQLSEISTSDLQFSREETYAFIAQQFGGAPKPETIARLEAQTEGWAAGLRLVTLALEGNREPSSLEQMLSTFSGGHQQVAEYLMAEVFVFFWDMKGIGLIRTLSAATDKENGPAHLAPSEND